MNPFPQPNSVIVMDNASWHFAEELGRVCDSQGVRIIYLPPYSPDLNPIEAFFGDMKKLFKNKFNPFEETEITDEEFMEILRCCALEVGSRVPQIQGHFRHAGVNFHTGTQGSIESQACSGGADGEGISEEGSSDRSSEEDSGEEDSGEDYSGEDYSGEDYSGEEDSG
jgi:hypothetical protein